VLTNSVVLLDEHDDGQAPLINMTTAPSCWRTSTLSGRQLRGRGQIAAAPWALCTWQPTATTSPTRRWRCCALTTGWAAQRRRLIPVAVRRDHHRRTQPSTGRLPISAFIAVVTLPNNASLWARFSHSTHLCDLSNLGRRKCSRFYFVSKFRVGVFPQ
jgi:hypothetical protein